MIGLQTPRGGGYALTHPLGPLFVIIRRRRLVYAELHDRLGGGIVRWSAVDDPTPETRLAGLQALARKVLVPNE